MRIIFTQKGLEFRKELKIENEMISKFKSPQVKNSSK